MYSILNLSQIWLFRLSMAFIAWNVCTMPTQIWNYSSYTTTFFLLVAYTISSTVCKHLWQNGARVSQNIPLSTSHALECLFLPLCTSSWSFSAFQDALSELDQIGEDSAQVSSFMAAFSVFLCDTSSISYQLVLLHNAKSWLIWKDPDARKDWGQEEKGATEDEMVGWHHRLNGHEFG